MVRLLALRGKRLKLLNLCVYTSYDKIFFMKKVGIGVGLLELGHNTVVHVTIRVGKYRPI